MTKVIIPLAGEGYRFKAANYSTIKPLLPLKDGTPMFIGATRSLNIEGEKIFVLRTFEGYEKVIEAITTYYPLDRFIVLDKLTTGPASTVYEAITQLRLNANTDLYTANCDQLMIWDGLDFQNYCTNSKKDGIVVTFTGGTTAHSFIKCNTEPVLTSGNQVVSFGPLTEKVKVGDVALTGIHYWKRISDCLESIIKMRQDKCTAPNGEYYLSLSYNYLLKANKSVGIYHIPNSMFIPIGVPEEYERYKNTVVG